jgi:hypothetical protein
LVPFMNPNDLRSILVVNSCENYIQHFNLRQTMRAPNTGSRTVALPPSPARPQVGSNISQGAHPQGQQHQVSYPSTTNQSISNMIPRSNMVSPQKKATPPRRGMKFFGSRRPGMIGRVRLSDSPLMEKNKECLSADALCQYLNQHFDRAKILSFTNFSTSRKENNSPQLSSRNHSMSQQPLSIHHNNNQHTPNLNHLMQTTVKQRPPVSGLASLVGSAVDEDTDYKTPSLRKVNPLFSPIKTASTNDSKLTTPSLGGYETERKSYEPLNGGGISGGGFSGSTPYLAKRRFTSLVNSQDSTLLDSSRKKRLSDGMY